MGSHEPLCIATACMWPLNYGSNMTALYTAYFWAQLKYLLFPLFFFFLHKNFLLLSHGSLTTFGSTHNNALFTMDSSLSRLWPDTGDFCTPMYTQAETVTEKNVSVLFSALYSAALTWIIIEYNLRAPIPACHGNNLLLVYTSKHPVSLPTSWSTPDLHDITILLTIIITEAIT